MGVNTVFTSERDSSVVSSNLWSGLPLTRCDCGSLVSGIGSTSSFPFSWNALCVTILTAYRFQDECLGTSPQAMCSHTEFQSNSSSLNDQSTNLHKPRQQQPVFSMLSPKGRSNQDATLSSKILWTWICFDTKEKPQTESNGHPTTV